MFKNELKTYKEPLDNSPFWNGFLNFKLLLLRNTRLLFFKILNNFSRKNKCNNFNYFLVKQN